jgi:hypothetical protein
MPDGRREVNAGQAVKLEVDAGPEMNSVQELEVDDGQGLDRGQGLEVNGRQEIEIDGEQDVEQDVDCEQEVNRRQRQVGDEYAMDGSRFQSHRNTCRHQMYCLQKGHMRCI